MLSDDQRHEFKRLVAMGRSIPEDPTPRVMLVARKLSPGIWSEQAQEHIDWCRKHGLQHSQTHFGGQFIVLRNLALIQAEDLLRELDRQAAGLPDLHPFNAMTLSKRLGERWWQIERADRNRHSPSKGHVSKKAADAVFYMKKADGIPAPKWEMSEDGAVVLLWEEEGRCAQIDIDQDGTMLLALHPSVAPAVEISFVGWKTEGARTLAAATDWVYFGGPYPIAATETVGVEPASP